MGPNGSGKSTFAKVLAGHPAYEVTGGTRAVRRAGTASRWRRRTRARAGLFLGFQYPVEIPGVANSAFLRLAYNTVQARARQGRARPARVRRFRAREDEAARHGPRVPRPQRQRRLLRRREEAQRDPADGAARAEARDPRRDRFGARHRRAAGRGERRQPACARRTTRSCWSRTTSGCSTTSCPTTCT